MAFSQIIHPSVTQYTLRDLEPGKQYTVCISIVFQNVSNKKAVLRDQCREVQTRPLLLSEKGISVAAMGTIVGSLIVLLILIMIIALVCQRRCMKKKAIPLRPLGPSTSARNMPSTSRQQRMLHPSRNANAATSMTSDEYDTAKIHIPYNSQPLIASYKHSNNPFLSPPPIHACANNANEPEYGNVFHNPRVIMMTHPPCAPSYAPPDVTETKQSLLTSDVFHYNRRLQRVSSVPPANIRELPVTIRNHVMRTANARDMDASSEFDLHRTYFFPKF
ncbi:uncharacterized protein [Asterias amurensis]|uniref:uncharacterized protein n=1 Tax=Asterias amurensis TaxID=7602 RepID=UPI003AB9031F